MGQTTYPSCCHSGLSKIKAINFFAHLFDVRVVRQITYPSCCHSVCHKKPTSKQRIHIYIYLGWVWKWDKHILRFGTKYICCSTPDYHLFPRVLSTPAFHSSKQESKGKHLSSLWKVTGKKEEGAQSRCWITTFSQGRYIRGKYFTLCKCWSLIVWT